jgi:prephenate dehydrogenase
VADPDLVIFALPTSMLSQVIEREIVLNPQSTFMDVGSVKSEVVLEIKTFSGLSTSKKT